MDHRARRPDSQRRGPIHGPTPCGDRRPSRGRGESRVRADRRFAPPAEPRIRFPTFDGKGVARLIPAIVRTASVSLRRDRGALALSFILPVVFFSIFASIFGGRRNTTPKVTILVVDEDHSRASQRLALGLTQEGSLVVNTRPDPVSGAEQPEYTATTAEAAVKRGVAPVAVIIPRGFGDNPIAFGPVDANHPAIQLLKDPSDIIAPQIVTG